MGRVDDHKGYQMWTTHTGGKAGKGRNKTSSIQIRKYTPGVAGHLVIDQVRYEVGNTKSLFNAMRKARAKIDDLIKTTE